MWTVGRNKLPFLGVRSQDCENRLFRPSVHMEQLGSHRTDFSWNVMFEYFSKNFRENSRSLKSDWGFFVPWLRFFYPDRFFRAFFLSCKANVRVKLAKTGHGPHFSILVICVVRLFVLFYVLFVCKCVLPPGDNPIAVNKYIIWIRTSITGTLHEDRYTFWVISRSFILRIRNVSDKSCTENQNTHFVFSNFFF
jgi:hypothetical protein